LEKGVTWIKMANFTSKSALVKRGTPVGSVYPVGPDENTIYNTNFSSIEDMLTRKQAPDQTPSNKPTRADMDIQPVDRVQERAPSCSLTVPVYSTSARSYAPSLLCPTSLANQVTITMDMNPTVKDPAPSRVIVPQDVDGFPCSRDILPPQCISCHLTRCTNTAYSKPSTIDRFMAALDIVHHNTPPARKLMLLERRLRSNSFAPEFELLITPMLCYANPEVTSPPDISKRLPKTPTQSHTRTERLQIHKEQRAKLTDAFIREQMTLDPLKAIDLTNEYMNISDSQHAEFKRHLVYNRFNFAGSKDPPPKINSYEIHVELTPETHCPIVLPPSRNPPDRREIERKMIEKLE
jgi:hypothetical protein